MREFTVLYTSSSRWGTIVRGPVFVTCEKGGFDRELKTMGVDPGQ